MHRGDPYGVPLCTYEHPLRGCSYQPEGVGKRQLFFSYRTVSLRLPGSYTNPEGVGSRYVMSTPVGVLIPTPKGLVHATFNARVRVRTILAILVAI